MHRLTSLALVAGLSLTALATSPAFAKQETQTVTGHVDAVTVYRGQALVTRLVKVGGESGSREIVISDLPQAIVPGSIYAEGDHSVEIRSLRYRTRPVQFDVRKEVREIDEKITQLNQAIKRNRNQQELIEQKTHYLDQLESFTASNTKKEMSEHVLDPDRVRDMTQFLFEQRQQVAERALSLSMEHEDLREQLQLAKRKRQQLTSGSSRTAREAVVFMNVGEDGGGSIRLHYLVEDASWSPSYNIRATDERDNISVEYLASIQQRSGEAWDNVALTLSTATPALTARAPDLEPFEITLARAQADGKSQFPYQRGQNSLELKKQQQELARQRATRRMQQESEGARAGVSFTPQGEAQGEKQLDSQLNVLANELQLMEWMKEQQREGDPNGVDREESLSVTYRLDGRVSLPSRSDQQLIQITSFPLDGEFYRVATPVLTSFVYEEAKVSNTSEFVLLEGPMAAYSNGQFVGHGSMPTVSIGESFQTGLGIDSSMRAQRELLNREEQTQGGNRLVRLTYRLSVENFSDAESTVRLFDRMPQTKGNEIKVTLVSKSEPLSDDSEYQNTQRKKGILRWDLNVPANATGTRAAMVEYTIELEYEKSATLSALPISSAADD